jgi:hypothetical protein
MKSIWRFRPVVFRVIFRLKIFNIVVLDRRKFSLINLNSSIVWALFSQEWPDLNIFLVTSTTFHLTISLIMNCQTVFGLSYLFWELLRLLELVPSSSFIQRGPYVANYCSFCFLISGPLFFSFSRAVLISFWAVWECKTFWDICKSWVLISRHNASVRVTHCKRALVISADIRGQWKTLT